jgi:tRNA threonylcarbamoyladenosine biosynthesis protein TsaB
MLDPNILCIESSAEICSVAIGFGKEIKEFKSELKHQHAEGIMDLIQTAVTSAQLEFKDLNAIVLSDGPGSYTGLRIGSSTAKGMCFALGIPLIAVSTLESLANEAFKHTNKPFVWPMIDARRMEVYHAIYNKNLQLELGIQNGIVTDEGFNVLKLSSDEVVLCGDGALKASGALGIEKMNILPSAAYLLDLGLNKYKNNVFCNLSTYEPFYLKSANITSPSKGK